MNEKRTTKSARISPRAIVASIMIVAFLFIALSAVAVFAEGEPTQTPTLVTDKLDYAPGEVVTITGTGFAAFAAYDIPVIRPDGEIAIYIPPPEGYLAAAAFAPEDWELGFATVAADSEGNFEYLYDLNGIEGTYEVRAYPESWNPDGITDSTNPVYDEVPLAVITFTDGPPKVDSLVQCDPPSPFDPDLFTCETSGAIGWVPGNNDGPFKEGETIPYRTRLKNLVPTHNYSITIEWDTTFCIRRY